MFVVPTFTLFTKELLEISFSSEVNDSQRAVQDMRRDKTSALTKPYLRIANTILHSNRGGSVQGHLGE